MPKDIVMSSLWAKGLEDPQRSEVELVLDEIASIPSPSVMEGDTVVCSPWSDDAARGPVLAELLVLFPSVSTDDAVNDSATSSRVLVGDIVVSSFWTEDVFRGSAISLGAVVRNVVSSDWTEDGTGDSAVSSSVVAENIVAPPSSADDGPGGSAVPSNVPAGDIVSSVWIDDAARDSEDGSVVVASVCEVSSGGREDFASCLELDDSEIGRIVVVLLGDSVIESEANSWTVVDCS